MSRLLLGIGWYLLCVLGALWLALRDRYPTMLVVLIFGSVPSGVWVYRQMGAK